MLMINLILSLVSSQYATITLACIIPVVGLLAAHEVRAAEPIDLLEIYQKALSFDGQYLKARAEHDASRELFPQARAGLLPSLVLEYQRSQTRQNTIASSTVIFPGGISSYPADTFSLTLTQPVFRWSNLVDLSLARLEMERADIGLALERVNLMGRVLKAYLDALQSRDEVDLSLKEEESVARQVKLAKTRYEAEIGRRADFLEARARFATVQANTTVTRNAYEDALQGLRETCGLVVEDIAGLDQVDLAPPDPLDVDSWVIKALSDNLEVAKQRVALEISRKQLGKQKSARIPTVDLVARQTNLDTKGTEFGGGREVETGVVELRLQVPIYQGGMVSSRIRQAVSLQAAEQDELDSRMRAVERETLSAFKDSQGAIRRVESLEQAVDAQELLVSTRHAGYPAVYNSLEVLDAEEKLFSARRDLARARYDYIRGTLRLKTVAGQLQEEDIKLINQWLNGN